MNSAAEKAVNTKTGDFDMIDFKTLKEKDPELYETYALELKRQRENIELIASENFVSPAVISTYVHPP